MSWRDFPPLATLITVLAVITMVMLGVWQLGRAQEKAAMLAHFEAIASDAPAIAYPSNAAQRERALYRSTQVFCDRVLNMRGTAGTNREGVKGWAHIADCQLNSAAIISSDPEIPSDPDVQTETSGLAAKGSVPKPFEPKDDGQDLGAVQTGEGAQDESSAQGESPDQEENSAQGESSAQEENSAQDMGRAQIVLGWSRAPETPKWQGGAVRGIIAPRGKIVADPALADLEPVARPDPNDLPNNHLSYAFQWFFFAITAIVIYLLALRQRRTSLAPPRSRG